MLAISCLRLADSKSNSSTRLPRRTTTRVSSGWVASISILFGIDESHDGGMPARDRPSPRRGRRGTARPESCLIAVEWLDLRSTRGNHIARNRAGACCAPPAHDVAPRRDPAAMGLVLDAQ